MEKRRIIFSEVAYTDLNNIEDYIAQDSPLIAQQFIERIFDRVQQLHEFPESGKIVSGLHDKQLREINLNRYRIIYRILNSKDIFIMRVIHGSRLMFTED